MPLDPAAMQVFATIARTGGVRGAAAVLGVPRSTVSRRLAALEKAVGGALVVRTSRRFALTELGVALAEPCAALEELLARSEDIARRASAEPQGTLRIASAPVLAESVLASVLADLTRRFPRLSVDVRLSVDYVDLRRGGVDVALRARSPEEATDLFATRLGTSVTGLWASPSYVAERGVPASPADLARHECILVGGAPRATWQLQVGSREQSVDVTGRIRVDSFRVARDLAAEGAGIVRMARVLAAPLEAEGRLVPILERAWTRTPIFAVHAGPNPPPPKVRVFLERARVAVAELLR